MQLGELTVQKDDMKAVLDKNLVYEKYLLSVLEESDDFVEIGDLLKRLETLKVRRQMSSHCLVRGQAIGGAGEWEIIRSVC